MKLKNKVAIITGGAGSIGKAIGQQLADEGAVIAVVDLNIDQAKSVADQFNQSGKNAIAVEVDVRDRQSVNTMVQTVMQQCGRIDILVNNAGGSARGDCALFHQSKDEVVDRVIQINLMGSIYCIRAAVEYMVKQQSGKIINIGSIVGMQGLANCADYAAAKGGIIAFTKSIAMELGEHGINVNCVSPGLVPRPDQDGDAMRKTNYLNAICSPDDVASMVRYLVTDDAKFITGQNFVVDGGRSLGLTKK
ncbi:MAG: dehydrogenase [Phycisphaeraceae bacterium]|nr:dehydrogenase [Phycisphaeraceae bacterium]